MIPTVIHYCWFGRKALPPLATKCIESWKRYLPDYEIKEWNEDNFDVNVIPYTQEAYASKKYAFVSDYARFWILYNFGGIYFDTDVEIIEPINDIIEIGPFMGCERDVREALKEETMVSVNPGLGMGITVNHEICKKMMNIYAGLDFPTECDKGKTIVHYTTNLLMEEGLMVNEGTQVIDGIYIYPKAYFCPYNHITGRIHTTPKTKTIHHYSGSWMQKSFIERLKETIQPFIAETILLKWHDFKMGRSINK